jgi:hypothetical protein
VADHEKNRDGQYISYPSFESFLNGGTDANGTAVYPKVDMSLWDQATMCATCHVGSPFYQEDRMGNRLPGRLMADWGAYMTGNAQKPEINPITSTVWESYDPTSGAQTSFTTFAPWAYPQFVGNNPSKGAVMAPNGWVPMDMTMNDPNTGMPMQLKKGQLMMPNVKEMDCLFCHLKGYDNVAASVMTQAGSLSATPGAGAGLFDMTPISPSYMGYNGMNGNLTFTNVSSVQNGNVAMVSLSDSLVGRILAKPDSNNCMQCHATKTLKNLPEMFGTTGTSNGFLSSAPMIYDPANAVGPLGKRMTAYDINAPFMFSGASDQINGGNYTAYLMPDMAYLQAMGPTPFRSGAFDPAMDLGGGNAAQTGPLYYYNTSRTPDQNSMKRSAMPFPRAEWFKRGDAWQDGKDVHGSFGCAGCHYTGDTTHKNQCDPGRGFDMMSGMEDGVPHLVNRNLTTERGGGFSNYSGLQTPDKHDTRNTVKRCEFCHVTGRDYYGNAINTYGAPNPTVAHQAAGLLANVVQIVDNKDIHGTFGGQGVSDSTNFTIPGKTTLDVGNHLDVMDCTVCHVSKTSMAVRTLDATSGMRFPAIIGTDPGKGMMGLFEDPAPTSFANYAAGQYNQMYQAMGMAAPYTTVDASGKLVGPDGAPAVGGKLQGWTPLLTWQKLGNLELPLTTNLGAANFSNSASSGMQFRRKIYLSNPIVAAIWNNTDPAVDANGDGARGGDLIGDNVPAYLAAQGKSAKGSLAGYKDIFSGDTPNKNNTQGFGEPIFDPWIMRDLKEGFNFGPGPLSVISVGFGNPSTTGSAYDLAGNGKFAASEYWKYVSVWSGAVVFTEPNQIRDYKNFRTQTGSKSWNGTELALVGDPFTVTHGVQPTATYVKGKSCTDCHAGSKGFFNGDFTMTGSAIPAARSYDPSAMLQTAGNPYGDSNTYLPALDAKGDPIRYPGLGMGSESNMMQRPLEPYRVKAYKGDLRTAFEGFNKLGQPRTTEFQQDVKVDGVDYVYTVPMQRADALYPTEKNDDGSELKIYYKRGDIDPATGTVRSGATAMSGRQYANYLEDTAQISATSSGIGIDPVATISSTVPASLAQNASLALSAANAQVDANGNPVGYSYYRWSYTDGTVNADGTLKSFPISSAQNCSVSFASTGPKTITLTVTDEEGKTAKSSATLQVVAPLMTVTPLSATHGVATGFTFGNLPAGTVKITVYWGDGYNTTFTSALTSAKSHTFATAGSKFMKVYAYSATGGTIGNMNATISVQ